MYVHPDPMGRQIRPKHLSRVADTEWEAGSEPCLIIAESIRNARAESQRYETPILVPETSKGLRMIRKGCLC